MGFAFIEFDDQRDAEDAVAGEGIIVMSPKCKRDSNVKKST